jgi:hypothetical protein
VLRLRGFPVRRRGVPLGGGELAAQLHLGALLPGLEPAGGGVGQPLAREGEVAVQLLELHSHRAQPPGDLASLQLRGRTRPGGHVPADLGGRELLPLRGEHPVELGEPRLDAGRARREGVEVPACERQLDRKLLLGQLGMPLGLALLAGQAPDL